MAPLTATLVTPFYDRLGMLGNPKLRAAMYETFPNENGTAKVALHIIAWRPF